MTDFSPTAEQQAILAAATETKDNILISALAGAAKTSTLVLIAEALRKTQILTLAFNVRIKDEMKTRLPPNCDCLTLNGLGHRALSDYLGKRLTLDTKKTYRILSGLIDGLPNKKEKSQAFDSFSDIMKAIDFGKSCGYIPSGHFSQAKALMNDDEFFACLDEEPTALEEQLIIEATNISIKEALQGIIDFGDQLLIPTVFPASFPYYPLVLVDEAQDLSALNHAMLRKVAKRRLIAVGDECQSIYGFRGAHQDSMGLLRKSFSMARFHLTISFRCPTSIVEAARWRAPAMQYPDWAKPGEVATLSTWSIDDIPSGDVAIICRNNAPLFQMAIRMLRDGRYPELVGNELGKSLVRQLKKLGGPESTRAEALEALSSWREAKLLKSRDPARVHDYAECLRVFILEGETLQEACEYANRVLEVAGPTKLMTGHKSKGLEFNHVIILDQDLINLDRQQEKNLLYVMQTRSKNILQYATSKLYFSERELSP